MNDLVVPDVDPDVPVIADQVACSCSRKRVSCSIIPLRISIVRKTDPEVLVYRKSESRAVGTSFQALAAPYVRVSDEVQRLVRDFLPHFFTGKVCAESLPVRVSLHVERTPC